jgi:hypothetical protein
MQTTTDHRSEVAIVGAGPAGLAAAELLSRHAVDITVFDEQRAAGGQFLRQPPREMRVRDWLPGLLYRKGKSLLQQAASLPGVTWRFETTVLGLFQNDDPETSGQFPWRLWLCDPERSYFMIAWKVLVAPGCYDRPVAFPGWTLPGVMATGGLQAMIKSQQVVPGDTILLAGSHPLQLIVADQIVKAGGTVRTVCFAQKLRQMFTMPLSPGAWWASRAKYLEALACLLRLMRAGVDLRFGWGPTRAIGTHRLEGLGIAPVTPDGTPDFAKEEQVAGDLVGICFGFLVSSELARQAGASARWSESRGGWVLNHDRWLRSDRAGLSVAGEITSVEGSDVAMGEGRLAALGLLRDLGRLDDFRAGRIARPIRRELARHRAFAAHLRRASSPPRGLVDALLADDTLLCRCEAVTAGKLKELLEANPTLMSANAVKLLGRSGMGLCQGRYCGHNVQNFIARHRNIDPGAVGGFTPQPPVKPLSIRSAIESMPGPGER